MHFHACIDVVLSVKENLRLDDWHKSSVLCNSSITCEAISTVPKSNVGGASLNGNNRSPLCETCTLLVVVRAPFE